MKDIYIITLSSLLHKRNLLHINAKEYMKGFILWLIFQGHVVSFSQEAITTIDGHNIAVDETAKIIFNKLSEEYRKYAEKKSNVAYL